MKMTSAAGTLYKNPALDKHSRVLMVGHIVGHREPVAWVHEYKGANIFYTSLGHQEDFRDANFLRMLRNALFWTAGRVVRPPAAGKGAPG